MKRIPAALLLIAIALSAFLSCNSKSTIYDTFNSFSASKRDFTLKVQSETNGETLESEYAVRYQGENYSFDYRYDLLNKIDLTSPDSEYKTTKRGSAVVEGGALKSHTEDPPDFLPGNRVLAFEEAYFSDINLAEGSFRAKVVNISAFFQGDPSLRDMTVEISYSESGFSRIVIRCSLDSSSITYSYTF